MAFVVQMVINTPKKHDNYTFTTVKQWFIFIRTEHTNIKEMVQKLNFGYLFTLTLFQNCITFLFGGTYKTFCVISRAFLSIKWMSMVTKTVWLPICFEITSFVFSTEANGGKGE